MKQVIFTTIFKQIIHCFQYVLSIESLVLRFALLRILWALGVLGLTFIGVEQNLFSTGNADVWKSLLNNSLVCV